MNIGVEVMDHFPTGREAHHSIPSSGKVTQALNYNSNPPYLFGAWWLIIFTFT